MNPSGENRSALDFATPRKEDRFWTTPGLAGIAVMGIVFVALAAVTWRKWPDPIIDFGTQVYIPWRITQGAVLYRDLYYFAGSPLSQYFNALLFKLFGVSFTVLIVANLAILTMFLVFIYRRFLAVSNVLTATAIGVGILVIFAFAQYTGTGNYNYIAPYSHEAIHGCFLSLFVLGILSDWLARPRPGTAALAGFLTGMVSLTKPDIFLALMACCAATVALFLWRQYQLKLAAKSMAAFGVAASVVPFLFFLLFLRSEDWKTSLHSIVFGWVPLFVPAVRNNPFYVGFRGMDRPAMHVREMSLHFVCAVAVIALYSIVLRRLIPWANRDGKPRLIAWLVWLVTVSPLVAWALSFDWINAGSSLPLWCVAALGLLLWQFKNTTDPLRLMFLILWTIFSLFLMSKLGLYARIWQVGFILAMPAFAITIFLLLWLLPSLLETHQRVPARFLRATIMVALVLGAAQLFHRSYQTFASKGQPLGKGGDTIYAFGPDAEIGEGAKLALDWIDKNIPTDGTLAVLPSGVNLNYLSRRINPTPCLFWDPNSMGVFGQENMTRQFEAAPPDYIMIIEQDQSEFGVQYLGQSPGYGEELMQWIKQNYHAAVVIGALPLRDGRFGIEFLKRSPAPTTSGPVTTAP